jgi:spermidine/putrescine-binding protein
MSPPLESQQSPIIWLALTPTDREPPYDKGLNDRRRLWLLGYTGLAINTKFVKVENEVSWDILFHFSRSQAHLLSRRYA